MCDEIGLFVPHRAEDASAGARGLHLPEVGEILLRHVGETCAAARPDEPLIARAVGVDDVAVADPEWWPVDVRCHGPDRHRRGALTPLDLLHVERDTPALFGFGYLADGANENSLRFPVFLAGRYDPATLARVGGALSDRHKNGGERQEVTQQSSAHGRLDTAAPHVRSVWVDLRIVTGGSAETPSNGRSGASSHRTCEKAASPFRQSAVGRFITD